jgi:hypothetical protein
MEDINIVDVSYSTFYNEIIREFKNIWESRTLNAIFDFGWEDMERALEAEDIGMLLQPSTIRSLEWLNENGKCIDNIVSGRSTVDGAG